ncbi:MAG: BolA family transcriptional regulator [Gammaproteobacteria bacterium]|nr:BolA family transcriptional regulator [Gammaproteobacteria bacterium]
MSTQERIERHLEREFAPSYLDVEDESAGHRGGAGAESHFRVVLVSDAFEGLPLIKRHRAVNACLADELTAGVHALALHTYTQQEWQDRAASARPSPACAGKS